MWEQRKFSDVAEIARGASPRPIQDKKWFNNTSEVGWLRISDVTEQNGRIKHLEQKLSELGQDKTRVLKSKHLLLSIAASVGKPVINYVDTGVHDGFLIFYNPQFNIEFMFQWLDIYRPHWQKYGQPGSQINLNSSIVKKQKVNLPTIEEQNYIADFLYTLETLIVLHQRKLEALQTLKQYFLRHLFTKDKEKTPFIRFNTFHKEWKQKKLHEVADIVGGGTPSTKILDYWNGDINWFTPAEIGNNRYLYKSNKQITKLGLRKSSAKLLPIGTVLFTSRAGIGNTVILLVEGSTNQGFQSIIPYIDILDSYFIFSKTKELKRYGERVGAGSTFIEVSKKQMEIMPILIPTIKEQKEIGEFFKKIDDIIDIQNKKMEKITLLKEIALQKMFI